MCSPGKWPHLRGLHASQTLPQRKLHLVASSDLRAVQGAAQDKHVLAKHLPCGIASNVAPALFVVKGLHNPVKDLSLPSYRQHSHRLLRSLRTPEVRPRTGTRPQADGVLRRLLRASTGNTAPVGWSRGGAGAPDGCAGGQSGGTVRCRGGRHQGAVVHHARLVCAIRQANGWHGTRGRSAERHWARLHCNRLHGAWQSAGRHATGRHPTRRQSAGRHSSRRQSTARQPTGWQDARRQPTGRQSSGRTWRHSAGWCHSPRGCPGQRCTPRIGAGMRLRAPMLHRSRYLRGTIGRRQQVDLGRHGPLAVQPRHEAHLFTVAHSGTPYHHARRQQCVPAAEKLHCLL
mmetsp:Transcript_82063/g.227560  ORF Transcript_82063/g.227560 Transcript_82063/m.227560 type:complete len:345 (+) Transcript_82063:367-1401(+)